VSARRRTLRNPDDHEETSMMMRRMRTIGLAVGLALLAGAVSYPVSADAQTTATDQRARVFHVPIDRVWTVTRSTLRSLGWDIDKEDREGGWIRTDSRRLEGEDFGVYAKGTRQRLRVALKALGPSQTQVTVERRVWKQERILWMDKEEDVPTRDHTAEAKILDDIAAAL
jgi:hypothetical protein